MPHYYSPSPLPDPLFQFLAYDGYDNTGFDYSATSLIDSVRQNILFKRHGEEANVNVQMNFYSVMGSALHHYFAHVMNKFDYESIVEQRIILEVLGRNIGFQPDFIFKDPESGLYHMPDLKHPAFYTDILKRPKTEWIYQINFYAWAVKVALDIEIELSQIYVFLRDWNYRESIVQKKHNAAPWPVYALDVDLWSYATTQNIIEDKVHKLIAAEEMSDEELEECSEAERWADKDRFAVTFTNGKTRGNAVPKGGKFETQAKAERFKQEYLTKQEGKPIKQRRTVEIDFRRSESKRCGRGYCPISDHCNQWQRIKATQTQGD